MLPGAFPEHLLVEDAEWLYACSHDNTIKVRAATKVTLSPQPARFPLFIFQFPPPPPQRWSLLDGSHERTFRGHSSSVLKACLVAGPIPTSHLARLYSGSRDCTIKEWVVHGPDAGKCTRTFVGHGGPIEDVCARGDSLFSASHDTDIFEWNRHTGQVRPAVFVRCRTKSTPSNTPTQIIRKLTLHTDWVVCLSLSPDGQSLFSGYGPSHSVAFQPYSFRLHTKKQSVKHPPLIQQPSCFSTRACVVRAQQFVRQVGARVDPGPGGDR